MVITERQDGLLIVGTEGRALEVESVDYSNSTIEVDLNPSQVPSQDKYISIRVGREERSNLTVTLVRTTNHTREVVFSYSRAQVIKLPHVERRLFTCNEFYSQMVPSYHNDVFWFYAHTSFVHGQDNVHCLDGLCRHRSELTN